MSPGRGGEVPPGLQLRTGEGGGLGWGGGARVGEVESEPREGRGLGEPGRLRSENEKPAKQEQRGKGTDPRHREGGRERASRTDKNGQRVLS